MTAHLEGIGHEVGIIFISQLANHLDVVDLLESVDVLLDGPRNTGFEDGGHCEARAVMAQALAPVDVLHLRRRWRRLSFRLRRRLRLAARAPAPAATVTTTTTTG